MAPSNTPPTPARLDPEAAFRHATELHRIGRLEEAEAIYRVFLAAAPTFQKARDNLGSILLTRGAFAEAWPFFEGRFTRTGRSVAKPALSFPEWRGESLDGKSILIWPEQGFGDQFLFARFAGALRDRGARVTALCVPPLERLFRQLGEVIVAKSEVRIPRHDYWIMTGSIPARLGTTLETLPKPPYLAAEPRRRGGVGVAWRGDPRNPNDAERALTPEALAKLRALGDFVSLHPEDTGVSDFQGTAEIIAGLDLVISIDTSIANLAGAMGKPCWVMLPFLAADWRWMQGETTAWYPSARLFRQPAPGDWDAVITAIGRELAGS